MPSASQQQPTVYVVDGDDDVRRSLVSLLGALGYAARGFSLFRSFAENYERESHGCLILDVRLSEGSGVALYEQFVRDGNRLPVIFISAHADVTTAVAAMKTGAVDFLEKPFDDEILLSAVRAARSTQATDQERQALKAAINERLASLSNRERDVLQGLVAGNPNKTIAYDLGISPRTVEIYRANVMTKMQAGSLSDLVRMALVGGILGDVLKPKPAADR
jgi:two-component system response regulator FixJ